VKAPRLVVVEWADSFVAGRWMGRPQGMANMTDPCIIESVGYLIEKTKNEVILASARVTSTDEFGSWHSIPRKMVKRIRTLEA
jgi:hypothetical protein